MNKAGLAIAAAGVFLTLGASMARAADPALASMRLAQPAHKLGAPVDLRYLVSGIVAAGQTASVEVAVVPRLEGTNLDVQVVSSDTMRVVADKRSVTRVAKADASAAYRQSLKVTPLEAGAGPLQVIVTMDVGDARYASLYNIALAEPSLKRPRRPLPAQ